MKTQVFKTWSDFYNRVDKDLNGVSEDFAAENPNYKKENESNKGCWNCSECSECSDCSDCSECSRCSRCSECSDCSECSRCSRCSECSRCSDLKDNKPQSFKMPETPIIQNIHQKVFEAVTEKGELKMDDWHTDKTKDLEGAYCGTTHCRAGWVIALSGKAGVELESIFGTENAAMQIYHKSSPEIRVSPIKFYQGNEAALEDIERCAKEEADATK